MSEKVIKSRKSKRSYFRPKVLTVKIIFAVTPEISNILDSKCKKANLPRNHWLIQAILQWNPSWVEQESQKKERPLTRKEEKQLEEEQKRRRCGIFTPGELLKWGRDLEQGSLWGYEFIHGTGPEMFTEDIYELRDWHLKFKEIFGVDWHSEFNYEENRRKEELREHHELHNPMHLTKTAAKRENREWRKTPEPE